MNSNIINQLNKLLELNPTAISTLIEKRVPVNSLIANHPDIPVTTDDELGLLGVLRFVTGEPIAAQYDEDGKLIKFIRT